MLVHVLQNFKRYKSMTANESNQTTTYKMNIFQQSLPKASSTIAMHCYASRNIHF